MDVPEMVERVARAICTADGYDPDYDGDIGFGPNKAWYELGDKP